MSGLIGKIKSFLNKPQKTAELALDILCLAASFVQHLTPMASSYGFSSSVTSLMLSLVLIMNTAGKFLIGALIDRIGTLRSTLLFIAFVLIATAVYYIS